MVSYGIIIIMEDEINPTNQQGGNEMNADLDNIKVFCPECCDYMGVCLILKDNNCICEGCELVLIKL